MKTFHSLPLALCLKLERKKKNSINVFFIIKFNIKKKNNNNFGPSPNSLKYTKMYFDL